MILMLYKIEETQLKTGDHKGVMFFKYVLREKPQ